LTSLRCDKVYGVDTDQPVDTRGYIYMKPLHDCNSITFSPAPLANLKSLSFRLTDPNGNIISKINDAYQVSNVFSPVNATGSLYGENDVNGYPLFMVIETIDPFPRQNFKRGERIKLNIETVSTASHTQQLVDSLGNYLNRLEGHTIQGVFTDNNDLSDLSSYDMDIIDGSNNSIGCRNQIIIYLPFTKTNGTPVRVPFTGETPTSFRDNVVNIISGYMLNSNNQIQLNTRFVMRT